MGFQNFGTCVDFRRTRAAEEDRGGDGEEKEVFTKLIFNIALGN